MTIEEKLKKHILFHYKSLRDFVNNSGIDMPYPTFDGILKRGINKSSIDNIFKICKTLDISADYLAQGRIVPNQCLVDNSITAEITDIVKYFRLNPTELNNFNIDGVPIEENEAIVLLSSLSVGIDYVRYERERNS